jgi:L-rhamnose isomerase / sugar isomerase
VRIDLANWLESHGLARDPFAAYLASVYQKQIAERRAVGTRLSRAS